MPPKTSATHMLFLLSTRQMFHQITDASQHSTVCFACVTSESSTLKKNNFLAIYFQETNNVADIVVHLNSYFTTRLLAFNVYFVPVVFVWLLHRLLYCKQFTLDTFSDANANPTNNWISYQNDIITVLAIGKTPIPWQVLCPSRRFRMTVTVIAGSLWLFLCCHRKSSVVKLLL